MSHAIRRVYLSLIIVALGPLLVFAALVRLSFDEDSARQHEHLLRAHAALLRHAVEEAPGDPAAAVAEVGRTFEVPVRLAPSETLALDAEQRAQVAAGEVAVRVDLFEVWAWARVGEDVAELGPIPRLLLLGTRRGALLILTVLGVAGLVVARLIGPLDRQMGDLVAAAQRFGRGELDARATPMGQDPAGELARTFNQMADRIGRQLDNQRALLHAVSHELRTPLARGRFGLALLERATSEDERRRRQADLERDLSELDALVGELLQYLRLEGGGATLEQSDVPLRELLGEVLEAVLPLRPDLDIGLEADGAPTVRGDARLLRRAVQNLATNAARHAAGVVTLGAAATPGGAEIWVDDDGPGIPEADRARIFQPFVRLGAREADATGTGLGLAIVRRVVEAHGGAVRAEPSPLGGARLRITLPGR